MRDSEEEGDSYLIRLCIGQCLFTVWFFETFMPVVAEIYGIFWHMLRG